MIASRSVQGCRAVGQAARLGCRGPVGGAAHLFGRGRAPLAVHQPLQLGDAAAPELGALLPAGGGHLPHTSARGEQSGAAVSPRRAQMGRSGQGWVAAAAAAQPRRAAACGSAPRSPTSTQRTWFQSFLKNCQARPAITSCAFSYSAHSRRTASSLAAMRASTMAACAGKGAGAGGSGVRAGGGGALRVQAAGAAHDACWVLPRPALAVAACTTGGARWWRRPSQHPPAG